MYLLSSSWMQQFIMVRMPMFSTKYKKYITMQNVILIKIYNIYFIAYVRTYKTIYNILYIVIYYMLQKYITNICNTYVMYGYKSNKCDVLFIMNKI